MLTDVPSYSTATHLLPGYIWVRKIIQSSSFDIESIVNSSLNIMYFKARAIIITGLASCLVEAANRTVSINPELTYLLPSGYSGNLQESFVDTNTTSNVENNLFASAQDAPFIAYDPEFTAIIGPNATLKLVAERERPFAGEAGVWVPDRNEVWFTSNTENDTQSLEVLDVKTSKIYTPQTSIPIVNPNGGCYFNGTVYITGTGTFTEAPCIYAINPSNGDTSIVLNTYFGLQFNGPNDVTWVTRGNKAYMLFTDDPIAEHYAPGSGIPSQLPDAVWRFDPQEHSLIPVISRADILIPNGIRVNANQTKLYVTDTTPTDAYPTEQGGAGGTGSPAIYVFDLDDDAFPINKRMLGISRTGISDGIHIDDAGRIWTAEYEGVVVRNPQGKVLGLFNSMAYSVNATTHVANFALAGDTLVIEDVQRLWTVKLAQMVVTASRFQF
jgi:gluconolactonase